MSLTEREVRARVERVESLLGRVESIADARARETALAAVQALVDLYGEGQARIVEHLAAVDDPASATAVATVIAPALARDELVAHLLLMHGLHPDDVETRVARALEQVQPTLRSHGASVTLTALDGSTARLEIETAKSGCGSTAATLRQTVEDAMRAAAPELEHVAIESVAPAPPLVQLAARRSNAPVLAGGAS